MVSGAGRLGRGRTAGRPGSLTRCAHRQRRGAALAAVAEEEHCTVERRADLSYAEFVQQYVRPPNAAPPPTPETRPGALSRPYLPAAHRDPQDCLLLSSSSSECVGTGTGMGQA